MSDNPLADWLRERGAWSGDGEPDAAEPATALGPPPSSMDADEAEPPGSALVRPGGPLRGVTDPLTGTPPGPLAGDWEAEAAPPPPRSRRLLLLGLAAVPWLGFAAVALGALGDADPAHDRAVATEEPTTAGEPGAPPVAEPDSPPSPEAPPASDARRPAPAGDAPARAGAERRAGAAASVAVRTALSGEAAGADQPARYVDLAVAESVEWVDDVAVVEVAAVVLESEGDAWGEPRTARYGVPVRVTEAGAVAIADPWPLTPPAGSETPRWEPFTDPGLAATAAEALADGGYDQVADVSLNRSDDAPGVLAVDVVAVAPGSRDAAPHRVLLRDADPPSLLTPNP